MTTAPKTKSVDAPPSTEIALNPAEDGTTHVNVYSRGKTELGQMLSNFAHVRFHHPTLGYFSSVEAFWYYVSTGCKHEYLRRLFGNFAKTSGKKLPMVPMDEAEFRKLICEAITCKIEQTPELLDSLLTNTLPLKHYYVFGAGQNAVVVPQPKHDWQIEHINRLVQKWEQNAETGA